MKFLHVSDLHMDRSFEGLSSLNKRLTTSLFEANNRILANIVNVAIKEDVDLVMIVGDTFHQSKISIHMQAFFIDQLRRLEKAQIHVVLAFGNHDFYNANRYWFKFPKNVHTFTTEEVETLYLDTKHSEKIAVTGFSYTHRWIETNKVKEFPGRTKEAVYHLGMYHGEQGTSEQGGKYAPFNIAEMKQKGYDYWALGHIHQPTILSEKPPIIYAGTPQGHSKKEKGNTGVIIGECNGAECLTHWVDVSEVSWIEKTITLTSEDDLKSTMEKTEKEILAIENAEEKMLLLEVFINGEVIEAENELLRVIENKEFLAYLQEKIYHDSHEAIWCYDVQRKMSQQPAIHLPLNVDTQLIEKLGNEYTNREEFEQLIKDMLSHQILGSLIETEEIDIQNRISEAKIMLLQHLGIEMEG